jgi:hypothetical protein
MAWRRPCGLLLAIAIAGCITPYDELPLCVGDARGEAPTTECSLSQEVETYRAALAHQVLRWSQWQYPPGLPLRVRLSEQRRVTDVCVGSPGREPSWSERDRVAASMRHLRAVPSGPTCLAGTTLELSGTLVAASIPDWAAHLPAGMTSCARYRDGSCPSPLTTVCGVHKDGRRRTYANACAACDEERVVGFFDFHCDP